MSAPWLLHVKAKSPWYEVVIDPSLDRRGETVLRTDSEPGRIVLREMDEEVLLHECLHALMHEGEIARLGYDGTRQVSGVEEDAVSHLSRGLFAMGWRLHR